MNKTVLSLFLVATSISTTSFKEAFTFDDILMCPRYTEVRPIDASVKTRLTKNIELNVPLISAAMDTVTEARLAVALAHEGGIGILHKNMSPLEQAEQVRKVKRFESVIIREPITISPYATLAELQALTKKHAISGVPVVENKKLVGIVTQRDIRFVKRSVCLVKDIMTPQDRLVTVLDGTDHEAIKDLFHAHRIEKILVRDEDWRLKGLLTVRDMKLAQDKPHACRDAHGRLRVGAAVSVSEQEQERVRLLMEEEVDVLVVDTAHGHSKGVIDMVKWIKQTYPHAQVIAGNIATAEGALALVQAGADAVKVGIGPGSICTTRIVTGVGVPQATAVMEVAQAVKEFDVPVIADGGIRYSGDISKALACGASAVMIGKLFAQTKEAPGEIELYQGRAYKSYRGMGSLGAMQRKHGSSDRYAQDWKENSKGLIPEGIEGRVVCRGALERVVEQLVGGVRGCMGYLGAASIAQMPDRVQFRVITNAGSKESHVHDVTITKEAPNYSISQ